MQRVKFLRLSWCAFKMLLQSEYSLGYIYSILKSYLARVSVTKVKLKFRRDDLKSVEC